jgi:hypothetical protein
MAGASFENIKNVAFDETTTRDIKDKVERPNERRYTN